MNDRHLKAAFPIHAESPTLDAKIDRALAHHTAVRRLKRRVLIGTAATAAATLAFVAFPAVQAQASMSGIVQALNGVTRLRVRSFTIDESGTRTPYGTTEYDRGAWHTTNVGGTRDEYQMGERRYRFDPDLKVFVASHQTDRMRSLRLSDMLGPAGSFSMGNRAHIEQLPVDGRPTLRATFRNGGLAERYVIDADPTTELPYRMNVETLERGRWRVGTTMEFDYVADVRSARPDLAHHPVITPEEADRRIKKTLTRGEIASLPLGEGRLVVRRVDVASDGTVFVLYQAGDRTKDAWRGHALNVSDSLGSRYTRLNEDFSQPVLWMEKDGKIRSRKPLSGLPDGEIEAEAFVPVEPIARDRSRTIALTAHVFEDGTLARHRVNAAIVGDEGDDAWMRENRFTSLKSTPTVVLRLPDATSTCGVMPAWAMRVSNGLGTDESAEVDKASRRAAIAMLEKRWPEAERQLLARLDAMKRAEAQGYGPYAHGSTLEDLDRVRAAQRP